MDICFALLVFSATVGGEPQSTAKPCFDTVAECVTKQEVILDTWLDVTPGIAAVQYTQCPIEGE